MVRISSTQKVLRVPRKALVRLVGFVADREAVRVAEVDLAVVSADEIAALNRRYLGRAGSTDVLSFDLSGPSDAALHAQVVVCAAEAVTHARRLGLRPQHELMRYVVHGLLHVMSYDDADASAAAAMHARQEALLAEFLRTPPPA